MELGKLYKYRSIWMGAAMLWVMLYHGIQPANSLLKMIQEIGYGGVDIFLFASGLGNYYSYTKDSNPAKFVARRILRLAPAYLLFMAIWIPYKIHVDSMPIRAIIGNAFGIQGFFVEYEFNWYITALLIMYLLTPIFVEIIKQISKAYQFALLIFFLLVLSIAFWHSPWTVTVTRFPVYLLGMYYAKQEKNNCGKVKFIIANCVCFMIGMISLFIFFWICLRTYDRSYLRAYGFYWYPFILIAPSMCMLLSIFFQYLSRYKIVYYLEAILTKIGEYSFEIFLIHVFFLTIYSDVFIKRGLIDNSNSARCVVLIFAGVGSIMLHFGATLLQKGISKVYNALLRNKEQK